MKNYISYMDRQGISPGVHEKLLNLSPPRRRPFRPWVRYGALAACAALIIGMGAWRLTSSDPGGQTVQDALCPGIKDWYGPGETPPDSAAAQAAPDYQPQPGEKDVAGSENPAPNPQGANKDKIERGEEQKGVEDSVSRSYPGDSFVVSSPVAEGETAFYYMPDINFQDMTGEPSVSPDWCWAHGTFKVFLGMEDMQKLFWGPEGIPETYQTEIGRQDLPWALFWDSYTLRAHAWYSPEGKLLEVYLAGEKDNASFELRMDPGQLPITCLYYPDVETSDVLGTEVTGWSKVYDQNGDDRDDYICISEFMTENEIGVRFESCNNGRSEDGLDGETWFNTLFVRQALVGGLHLDHLLTTDDIPDDPDATW